MKKILKLLQAIQVKAWEKGVNSFTINSRWFDDGDSGVIVTIFLEDNTRWEEAHPSEESIYVNYLNVHIYGDAKLNGKPTEWQMQQVQTIAEFVGVEVKGMKQKEKPTTTALYSRKRTTEEIAAGNSRDKTKTISVPVKDVFLGVTETCGAVLKRSVIGPDGKRYFFVCVNYIEQFKNDYKKNLGR